MGDNALYGPPPVSPFYQGDCRGTPYPNPYFPKPSVTWEPQPPFWYKGNPCPPQATWPVGHPDDYKYEALPQPLSDKTLLEELEIERPERYLPGEIYKNEAIKSPIQDLSTTANCQSIWTPLDPGFCCEFQPTFEMMNPPLLLDGVLRRKAQTFNSYIIPKAVKFTDKCECVEDTETKSKPKPNYFEALKYADTRPHDFKCEPDTSVKVDDACKIPDTSVKVPPAALRKILRSSGGVNKNMESDKVQNKKCECGCKNN